MIEAKIIADSINEHGCRITTFVLTFPRIILAELNTHRALSRNSASSRAIPFNKMVDMVEKNPFIPIAWMKDHKGMQGTEYLTDIHDINGQTETWLNARNEAVKHAKILNEQGGITKQLCNRLLEPFMWHTAIVTATEWENFFALRAHPDAEIHIQDLAFKALEAYNSSTPKLLKAGEWHIPFGDTISEKKMNGTVWTKMIKPSKEVLEFLKVKIATARCARVSYLNFDGKDDYEADIKLHDRLSQSGHWSPFEHCAQAMPKEVFEGGLCDVRYLGGDEYGNPKYDYGWSGNFKGWKQYRKTFENENKADGRVKKTI